MDRFGVFLNPNSCMGARARRAAIVESVPGLGDQRACVGRPSAVFTLQSHARGNRFTPNNGSAEVRGRAAAQANCRNRVRTISRWNGRMMARYVRPNWLWVLTSVVAVTFGGAADVATSTTRRESRCLSL